MASGSRASLRRQPRKTYTIDAFDGIEGLQSLDSAAPEDDDGSDQDFDAVQPGENADEDDQDFEDDEIFDDEVGEQEADDKADDDDTLIGTNDLQLTETETPTTTVRKGKKAAAKATSNGNTASTGPRPRDRRFKPRQPPDKSRIYTRGLDGGQRFSMSKTVRRRYLFGPAEEDQLPVIEATRRWAYNGCLPHRQEQPGHLGGYVYAKPYQKMFEDVQRNWKWWRGSADGNFADGGREAFRQGQRLVVDNAATREFGVTSEDGARAVLMGPIHEQKLFMLNVGQSVSLAEPFALESNPPKTIPSEPIPSETISSETILPEPLPSEANRPDTASTTHSSYKAGFVINLGERVHCVEWAPDQPGDKQYLAASILPLRHARSDNTYNPTTAFEPQPPYSASVQIWEFTATAEENYIDKAHAPVLRMVLCMKFGDIKMFKWCPVPAGAATGQLGLLAVVTGDGAVRVLEVERPAAEDELQQTLYYRVERAAFTSKPPDTVCTGVTWISSSRLAASCANGFVAVWDLARSFSISKPVSTTSNTNPRPTIYTSIHPTYILNIASCFPSHPEMILTSSMSGYVTLTNLGSFIAPSSSPATTAYSPRTRIGIIPLCWHEMGQSALCCDDNCIVKALVLRRFYGALGVGRAKSHAYAFAASYAHPCYLLATAQGDVVASNPLRRIVAGGKAQLWQLTWFAHEWRRERDGDQELASRACTSGDEVGQACAKVIARNGISRITEGYRATKTNISLALSLENIKRWKSRGKYSGAGDSDDGDDPETEMMVVENEQDADSGRIPAAMGGNARGNDQAEGRRPFRSENVAWTTTHEERSAVTAVAWNPNLHVAGWAAAGMADGLLRIEDLGI